MKNNPYIHALVILLIVFALEYGKRFWKNYKRRNIRKELVRKIAEEHVRIDNAIFYEERTQRLLEHIINYLEKKKPRKVILQFTKNHSIFLQIFADGTETHLEYLLGLENRKESVVGAVYQGEDVHAFAKDDVLLGLATAENLRKEAIQRGFSINIATA